MAAMMALEKVLRCYQVANIAQAASGPCKSHSLWISLFKFQQALMVLFIALNFSGTKALACLVELMFELNPTKMFLNN